MKAIYELDWEGVRGYSVSGLFVAEKAEVQKIMGKRISFGEICGKHSDVELEMGDEVLNMLSEDEDFVRRFVGVFGEGTITGHNPLDYYDSEDV